MRINCLSLIMTFMITFIAPNVSYLAHLLGTIKHCYFLFNERRLPATGARKSALCSASCAIPPEAAITVAATIPIKSIAATPQRARARMASTTTRCVQRKKPESNSPIITITSELLRLIDCSIALLFGQSLRLIDAHCLSLTMVSMVTFTAPKFHVYPRE